MIYPNYSSLIKEWTVTRVHSCSIIIYEDMIYLERRADNGLWGLIGGKIETGESPEQALIREVYEETNLVVDRKRLKLQGVYGDVKDGRIVEYEDSSSHVIDIVYTYESASEPIITISEESLSVDCFKHGEIPWDFLVRPANRPLLDFIAFAANC